MADAMMYDKGETGYQEAVKRPQEEDGGLQNSCFYNMSMDYPVNDYILTGCTPTSYNSSTIETDATLRHADYMPTFGSFDAYNDFDGDRVFPMSGLYMFQQFEHGDSYLNKFGETGHDADPKNNSLTMRLNSLTESVLKQLETPIMEPSGDPNAEDSGSITDIDPRLLERLYNAGVNIGAIVSPMLTKSQFLRVGEKAPVPTRECQSNAAFETRDTGISVPPLDLNSMEVSTEEANEYNQQEDKKSIVAASKNSKLTKRRSKRAEEARVAVTSRAGATTISAPKSLVANASNRPIALKAKVLSKGSYYSAVTPSAIKSAILGNKSAANVTSIAKDQAGCRMLQKLLDTSDESFIDAVLEGVINNVVELMTDPFGNYLCQKLMSVCSESQLNRIIKSIGDDFVNVALNMHGTRALQKLIEVVRRPDHVEEITRVLSEGAVELVTDLNGNHVIQTCLTSLSPDECEFIYVTMYDHCIELATHRHGCCVMQRCIDAANDSQRKKLIEIITENVLHLVEDAYGNYVIQYTLRLKLDDINTRIVKALAPNVTEFAKQKYSSNVIERCLMICSPETRSILIERFISAPFHVLKDLILHPFGNYVIQRVLSVAQKKEVEAILDNIQPHMEELRSVASGKRIAAKIGKRHYGQEEGCSAPDRTLKADHFNGKEYRGNVGVKLTFSHGTVSEGTERKGSGSRRGTESSAQTGTHDKQVVRKGTQSRVVPKTSSLSAPESLSTEDTTGGCNDTEADDDAKTTDASPNNDYGRKKKHVSIGLLEMLLTRKVNEQSNAP